MARKRKSTPEINGSSMADVAFILLVFFIVSTTMDVDSGIYRVLPHWVEDVEAPKINKRNTFVVSINKNNDLGINGEYAYITDIKDRLKEFILNPRDDQHLSEKEFKEVEGIPGTVAMSKGIVSLQNDRGTDYGAYMEVQNELVKGFNELRDEFSMATFGMRFDKLDEAKQEAVRKVIPTAISEAEPEEIK
ncbi:MAG: biopolymer transporter ExbD [Bacteroidales bacterium]|nr:biopolymer transporter ExbD [Bacteroidales bacterium]